MHAKYKKIIYLGLFLLLACGLGSAAASAKTVTVKKAAKKVQKAWNKAYRSKKTETVTVSFKTKKKNNAKRETKQFQVEMNKLLYGTGYIPEGKANETQFLDVKFKKLKKSKKTEKDDNSETKIVTQYRNRRVTYQFTFYGKKKWMRKQYEEIQATKSCAAEIKKATKGMDQFERAWYTNLWVMSHSHFEDYYMGTWADLKNKKAQGVCWGLADFYNKVAMYAGVKHFGAVANSGHTWNVVKIGGKKYYLDVAHSLSGCEAYYQSNAGLLDFLNNDIAKTETKKAAKNFYMIYEDKAPMAYVKMGYGEELFRKITEKKNSMTKEQWKAKIDAYWQSDYCVLYRDQYVRSSVYVEPWETEYARFGLQTAKQTTDYNYAFTYGEAGTEKSWRYTWVQ